MKIAQVAPLFERVPPKRYGGIERVVSYLTEELIRQKHDVSLFASGDSITNAELVACCPKAIRDFEQWVDPIAYHAVQLHQLFERTSTSFTFISNTWDSLSRNCCQRPR
ncbi:MAG TPA: hypothetical protein VH351_22655 [Bryobacteraceae bacterium]|nr:hypothetical protein [Bryobacteraceae bacterium]